MAARYFALLDWWEGFREDAWENVWKRTAVICRYGRTGYEDALRMPLAEANAFGHALNELIKDEQSKIPTGSK